MQHNGTDKKPLILVVDDYPENVDVLSIMLRNNNYDVIVASGGNAAFEVLDKSKPDAILLDVMMPVRDGFEVCKTIKQIKEFESTPIIFLTARTDTEDIIKAFDCGGSDYITKPFKKGELLARLKTHLELKRVRTELEEKIRIIDEMNKEKDTYIEYINRELAAAADYVTSLLPKKIENSIIDTDWKFVPSYNIGGDSFGYHWIDENNFAIYLLDVSGHGISASLQSISALNLLKFQILADTDFHNPEEVLRSLNNTFQIKQHNYLYFTIWYGVYNKLNRILKFAGAGHPPALLFSKENGVTSLSSRNIVIGAKKDYEFHSNYCLVPPGAELYVYSDGVYSIVKNGAFVSIEQVSEIISEFHGNGSEIESFYRKLVSINDSEKLPDDFSMLKIIFS
ncbi:MAG: PP2C family protein-serine/threonine phosphatase [Chloroflexota bacterium]